MCRIQIEHKYDERHKSPRQPRGIPLNTQGSIALVTGASSGIGKATAERFATAGYNVYGTSRRGASTSQQSYRMLPLDVTSNESVEAAGLASRMRLLRRFATASVLDAGVRKDLRLEASAVRQE